MILPAGVGNSQGGQAEGPQKCWGDIRRLDAYGQPLAAVSCHQEVFDDDLRLCAEHRREIINPEERNLL